LLIVADDLGYSDVGAFGGEIQTPNLDRLAAEGRLLTDHHTAATCSPTRAMLLSGSDHHLVGLGSMAELLSPNQVGKPGYEGYLNERSLSIAQLLLDSGYHTYIAGKWHLGTTEERSPKAWGFESSFVLVNGASSHFAPDPKRPTSFDRGVYRQDGKVTSVPADFFSTNFYTDKLIGYIEAQHGDGKPFFAFAAFTAPHWPLQAPDADLERYRGRYDGGYEAIRSARLARQQQLGIIPSDLRASPGQPDSAANPRWHKLNAEQQRLEARRMEVYAAMVDNLDRNVGRLLATLQELGVYEDTFIFFQSDNGAEAEPTRFRDNEHIDNHYENLGRPFANVAYGRRWAEVSATPFRLWKGTSGEGGVLVPAIARLPRQAAGGAAFRGVSHVSDLAPTFLALAGAPNPGSRYREREVHPITGVSLLPALRGGAPPREADSLLSDELFGRRYVRRGAWKLSFIEPPLGTGAWELYNLESDRGETKDLAREQPELVRELSREFEAYAARVKLVLPSQPGF